MNRILSRLVRTSLVAAVALTAGAISAQAARVAVVDMALVYKSYPEVTKTTFYLKTKKDEYQAEIDKERRKIEEISQTLKEGRNKLGDSKVREKENQKRRMLFDLQSRFQGFKEKLQDMEKEEFEKIRDAVKASLAKIARRKGYDMVIEKQWLYYGESEDITAAVITALGGDVPDDLKKKKRGGR